MKKTDTETEIGNHMVTVLFVSLGLTFIVALNLWAIERDERMFDAYNRVCATLPQPHPDCRFAK